MLQNTTVDSGLKRSSSAASCGARRAGSASKKWVAMVAGCAPPPTLTSRGSRSIAVARVRMASGKVAENSRPWRSFGVRLTSARIGSSKPMSSMRSASSSTSTRTPRRSSASFCTSSSTRPGVPTTTCGACASEASCGASGMPPHSTDSFRLAMPVASLRNCLPTWSASSRVGHSTSAWVPPAAGSILCSRPSPNAAVLPLPVGACAMRSRPCRIAGSACAWMGVRVV